jgi:hypothetical protein
VFLFHVLLLSFYRKVLSVYLGISSYSPSPYAGKKILRQGEGFRRFFLFVVFDEGRGDFRQERGGGAVSGVLKPPPFEAA